MFAVYHERYSSVMTALNAYLEDSFHYDLWANKMWLPVVLSHGGEVEIVFRHLFASQTIWQLRVDGSSPLEFPPISLASQDIEELNGKWLNIIRTRDLNEVIDYQRTTGEPMRGKIGDIAHHVINHGTYHRGHIRGLLDHVGGEHLPGTDFIGFTFEREFKYPST